MGGTDYAKPSTPPRRRHWRFFSIGLALAKIAVDKGYDLILAADGRCRTRGI